MIRPALLLLSIVGIAACTPPPQSSEARANAVTLAACREQADAAYNRTHRDTIYTISSRDTPFSGNYTPGVVDRGLAQRFGRENMVRDCVRNTGTETDRAAAVTPPPAPALPPSGAAPRTP